MLSTEIEVNSPTFPGFFIEFNEILTLVDVDDMMFSRRTTFSLVIVNEQLADRLELHVIVSVVGMEKLSDGNEICILLVDDKVCWTSIMNVYVVE